MSVLQKVWLITAYPGTSSGLGRNLVNAALARGDKVIATARTLEKIQDLKSQSCSILQLDVTDKFDSIKMTADAAVAVWGRVDVLVNNAGYGMVGFTEDVGTETYMKQFQTNFFGPVNVTNAFLPHMRERRDGTIVFVGSRSSYRTQLPMLGPYASSKAALAATAEVLGVELAPFGIRVLSVLPGGLRTENWNNTQVYVPGGDRSQNLISDYAPVREAAIKWMHSQNGKQLGDPVKAAEAMVDLVRGEGPGAKAKSQWPLLLALGEDAEIDIRDKCNKVLENMEEWQDVTRSIAFLE